MAKKETVAVTNVPDDANSATENGSETLSRSSNWRDEEIADYPDGGWRAWSVVLGTWCALVPTFGVMNVTGLLESWLSEHQLRDYSKASVSWIFSLWIFFLYVGGLQVGPIFDKHGLKVTMIPGTIGVVVLPRDPNARIQVDLRSLKEGVFVTTSLGVCMAEVGLMIVTIYLPSYAIAHGVRGSMSYNIISIFNAGSIVGRVLPGFLADYWGRFNVMFVTSYICIVLACGLWLNADQNEAAILSFAVLFGFWTGPVLSLTPVCVAQISATEDYGKRYGVTVCLIAVATLVTVPVAGEILKAQNEDYSGLVIFCGASYACCSLLLLLAKGLSVGWRPTKIF
ncbi:hypothetical protein FE257_009720 [Aspergillus nanangensis]|uniref:Major facilitator superfamily (MFS) profile domain-containing protein n=1 Tax=Aspergillus nanangensis TaxID=2582783 RepID=A0AAD4CL64_ASPNN|nr:hypothetical protein FE257_009720 [Aspergillus nanangensis]